MSKSTHPSGGIPPVNPHENWGAVNTANDLNFLMEGRKPMVLVAGEEHAAPGNRTHVGISPEDAEWLILNGRSAFWMKAESMDGPVLFLDFRPGNAPADSLYPGIVKGSFNLSPSGMTQRITETANKLESISEQVWDDGFKWRDRVSVLLRRMTEVEDKQDRTDDRVDHLCSESDNLLERVRTDQQDTSNRFTEMAGWVQDIETQSADTDQRVDQWADEVDKMTARLDKVADLAGENATRVYNLERDIAFGLRGKDMQVADLARTVGLLDEAAQSNSEATDKQIDDLWQSLYDLAEVGYDVSRTVGMLLEETEHQEHTSSLPRVEVMEVATSLETSLTEDEIQAAARRGLNGSNPNDEEVS